MAWSSICVPEERRSVMTRLPPTNKPPMASAAQPLRLAAASATDMATT